MGAGQDLLKKALATTGGGVGMAAFVADVASSENKISGLASAVRNLVQFSVAGWAGAAAGGFASLRTVVKALVVDSGSLEAALRRLNTFSLAQTAFAPFLRGASAAKQRVVELAAASNRPFGFGELVTASRNLEVLTRGAYSGSEALKEVQDAAAKAGQRVDLTAGVVGGFNAALREGKPVEAYAEELRAMGVISDGAARNFVQMEQRGAGAAAVFAALRAELQKSRGGSDAAAKGIGSLTEQAAKAQEDLRGAFGKSFAAGHERGIELQIDTLNKLQPVLERMGNTLAPVARIGETWGAKLKNAAVSTPGFATAVDLATRALVLMGAAAATLASFNVGSFFVRNAGGLLTFARSLTLARGEMALLGAETRLAALASAQSAAGNTVAARGLDLLADGAGAAAKGVGGLGAMLGRLAAAVGLTALVAGLAAAFWKTYEAGQEHARALTEIARAGNEVVTSLEAQISAMRSVDDQQKALLDVANARIAAEKKLAEIKEKGGDKVPLAARASALIAAEAIREDSGVYHPPDPIQTEAEAQQKELDRINALPAKAAGVTGLAPSTAQKAINERIAHQQVEVREAEFGARMALASPGEQFALRGARITDDRAKIADGQRMTAERARLTDAEKAPGLTAEQIEDLRLSSQSPVIRGHAETDRAEREGRLSHADADTKRRALEATRVDLEDNLDTRVGRQPQLLADQGAFVRSRDAYARDTGRGLEAQRLSLSGNADERLLAAEMGDAAKALAATKEGIGAGLSPKDAAAFAGQQGLLDLQRQQREGERGAVVDSLQRVGGGGGVGTGDSIQLQQRSNALLEQILRVQQEAAKDTGAKVNPNND